MADSALIPKRESQHQVRSELRRDARDDVSGVGTGSDRLAHSNHPVLEKRTGERTDTRSQFTAAERDRGDGSVGFWDRFILIGPDRDGKYWRIEPGTFPVAPRVPETMDLLRAFGNAVNPELAAEVVRAYMDVRGITPVYHPAILEMLRENERI